MKPGAKHGSGTVLKTLPRKFLVPATIILFTFLAYFKCLGNGFAGDDSEMIVENPWIKSLALASRAFFNNAWGFEKIGSSYYRPLQQMAYMVLYSLFGLRPLGWHLASIALHALNSVLVYFLAREVTGLCFSSTGHGRTENGGSAAGAGPIAAALIFAAHPVHLEAVVSSSAFPDLMAAFFSFLALLVFIKHSGRSGYAGYFVLELSLLLSAFLSKEPSFAMPLVFVAYDVSLGKLARQRATSPQAGQKSPRPAASAIIKYIPALCAMVAYSWLRINALGRFTGVDYHPELGSVADILSGAKFFALYLFKTFSPVNLNPGYDYHPVSSMLPLDWKFLVAALTTMGFILFLAMSSRKSKSSGIWNGYLFSGLFYALPLLPALDLHGLVDFLFAERYLYMPAAGFSIALGITLEKLLRGNIVKPVLLPRKAVSFGVPIVLAPLLVFYAASDFKRAPIWKNNSTLWTEMHLTSPDNGLVELNYGDVLRKEGRLDEAIAQYRQAIRKKPYYLGIYVNLGGTLMLKGDNEGAAKVFQDALFLNLDAGEAPLIHRELANAYLAMGKTEPAIAEFRISLQQLPDAGSYREMAGLLCRLGRSVEAEKAYRQAFQLDGAGPLHCDSRPYQHS
ncbi:MAG: tetratricopeptide repeat protein [Actinomycetota bacterium]|nr:tetratricopeptide repeat protein [Actinomycetota bacterium]